MTPCRWCAAPTAGKFCPGPQCKNAYYGFRRQFAGWLESVLVTPGAALALTRSPVWSEGLEAASGRCTTGKGEAA